MYRVSTEFTVRFNTTDLLKTFFTRFYNSGGLHVSTCYVIFWSSSQTGISGTLERQLQTMDSAQLPYLVRESAVDTNLSRITTA